MSVEGPRYLSYRSTHSYANTIAILTNALASGGNTIFATIDQSAAARQAGLNLRPTTLIVFGNPKGGTPLMQAFPAVALELPLKLLVWEDEDGVNVAYTPLSEIASRYGIADVRLGINAIDAALEKLAGSIT